MPRNPAGDRGEFAASPYDVPLRGWRQVLVRVKGEIAADNLSIVAAGVAFYSFLAIVPAISAFVIIYGLLADPSAVERQIAPIEGLVPPAVYTFAADQLRQVTSRGEAELSLGLALTLGLALWSAMNGIKALFVALNIAYEQDEGRGFVRLNVVALLFTVGGIFFVILSLSVIAVIPVLIELISPGGVISTALLWLQWPVMIFLIVVALALVYRYGPNRRQARLKWVTPGAGVAAILWLAGSVAFSVYVVNFADYSKTFGSLGAIVVLLFWFYISAYAVCIGAELNAELEHQTYRDSTIGPARPAGSRGAYVADHTAEAG